MFHPVPPTVDWSDCSPPNLLTVGQWLAGCESEYVEDLKAPSGWPGAETVYEMALLEEIDPVKAMEAAHSFFQGLESGTEPEQNFQILFELVKKDETAPKIEAPAWERESDRIELHSDEEVSGLTDFCREVTDILEELDNSSMQLREKGSDLDVLNNMFRSYHTIKGTSGFFDLNCIREVTHKMEDVLDRARRGELEVDDEVVAMLIKGNSWLSERFGILLQHLESGTVPLQFDLPNGVPGPVVYGCLAILARQVKKVQISQGENEEKKDSFIRVPLVSLDALLGNIGNLINLTHVLRHQENNFKDAGLPRHLITTLHELLESFEKETSELQSRFVDLRRVKLEKLLKKVPKIIFRLSRELGKQVAVDIRGEELEVDRSILSALEDPVVHILRNSMDHGFETPDERKIQNKAESGTLSIHAEPIEGDIMITLSDDGKGINPDKVASIALERGVITQSEADKMTDKEKQLLVFRAGFSTASGVSQLSGRGVGMDVVRQKIRDAGGSVEVNSVHGKGTSLKIRMPSMAVLTTRLLLGVICGKQRFALPLQPIDYLYRLSRDDSLFSKSGGAEVLKYRGSCIPVLHLSRVLNIPSFPSEERCIVILRMPEGVFALEVDELEDFENLVTQKLPKYITESCPIESATVLGNGDLSLVIDLPKVMAGAGIRYKELTYQKKTGPERTSAIARLVFEPGGFDCLLSMPIERVSWIERFFKERLKPAGNVRAYLSNRGCFPCLDFSSFGIGSGISSNAESQSVLFVQVRQKTVALMIEKIIDLENREIRFMPLSGIQKIHQGWSWNGRLVADIEDHQQLLLKPV